MQPAVQAYTSDSILLNCHVGRMNMRVGIQQVDLEGQQGAGAVRLVPSSTPCWLQGAAWAGWRTRRSVGGAPEDACLPTRLSVSTCDVTATAP